jgi:hypothetical protein
MKSTLVVICLCCSAFCVGQTNPTNPTPEDQSPAAAQNGPRNGHRPPGVAGTITVIDGNTLTIKTRGGQSTQVTLSDKTQYRKDREPAKFSDLKVGDMVFVRGEKNGDNSWQAEMVGRPHLRRISGQFPRRHGQALHRRRD